LENQIVQLHCRRRHFQLSTIYLHFHLAAGKQSLYNYAKRQQLVSQISRRSPSRQSLKIGYKRPHNQSQNQHNFLTVIVFLVLYSNFFHMIMSGPDVDDAADAAVDATVDAIAGASADSVCGCGCGTASVVSPLSGRKMRKLFSAQKMLMWFYIFALKQTNRHFRLANGHQNSWTCTKPVADRTGGMVLQRCGRECVYSVCITFRRIGLVCLCAAFLSIAKGKGNFLMVI